MINIEKEILTKFPKLSSKTPMLQKSLFKIAQKLVHEDKINDFLKQHSHLKGFEFVEAVLDYFKFDFSYSSKDIENIPSSGRVVIISNHPLGALDALCLLKLVSSVRKDVRIVANDFLAGIDSLNSLFIKIDNYKTKQSKENIKKIYTALDNEEAVIIFPAGEVSRVSPTGIKDGKWQKGFLKFAKKSNSPILPILVDAKNSKTFYTVSILNKTFSTILLSDEMFKQRDKNVTIKVGKLIANEHILHSTSDKLSIVDQYKKHLYGLKKGKKQYFETINTIAREENRQSLKKELKSSQLIGQTADGKKIYLYDYVDNSAVMNEIGRLREISFRKVNEGVNKKRDLDQYDQYYKHIVLWDDEDLEIVGAYRIGEGKNINAQYGKYGFYSNTLFRFKKPFVKYLDNSIELGRSFVQPKYWGTRALDYLWYGIGAYLKHNPEVKYMFGPVSLSGNYPQYAKELIVDFYSNYFGSADKLVEAQLEFEFETSDIALDNPFSYKEYKDDFKLLKNKLKSMDLTIPTLYKQYSELCEEGGIKFYDFNIDPDFSNCIDSFIVVEIAKIKQSKLDRYMG
ncbi:MAG: lysophospholipid acyltransferase family protein [Arcobacteraceae bacterium]|nr:lysophospholipid acyltransferase family protein [Arcobacteraceae bacterium]